MVYYDPFSYQTQHDPYPTYRTLLDQFPLYYNEQRGFWELSRFADVQAAFREKLDRPVLIETATKER